MGAREGVRDYQRRFTAAIQDALDDLALEIVEEAKAIISAEAIDTGTLHRSDEIREPSPLVREVAFTAAHAEYVHYGTEPHWPPLAPIKAWVLRNLTITPTGAELKAGIGEGGKPPTEAAIDRVAHAIQAKIARDGTDAVPFLSRAAGKVRPRVATVMKNAVDRALGP